MRWGSGDAQFVRPVHWLVMLLGTQVVPARVLGLPAGRSTRGHRFHAPEPFDLADARDYAATLEAARPCRTPISRRGGSASRSRCGQRQRR